MYSVLSALTWRSMLPAARSRLCKDSAWASVFSRRVMSAAVIVCAGYLLLLFFATLKPFSFIKSIDVLSTYSWQMINRYRANVSPCSTPATMSNIVSESLVGNFKLFQIILFIKYSYVIQINNSLLYLFKYLITHNK